MRKAIQTALAVAAFAGAAWACHRAGRLAALQEVTGDGGPCSTAIIDWTGPRKATIMITNEARAYCFTIQLEPQYAHFTHTTKVFTASADNPKDVRATMKVARAWTAKDPEGADRIPSGRPLDPTDWAKIGLDTIDPKVAIQIVMDWAKKFEVQEELRGKLAE